MTNSSNWESETPPSPRSHVARIRRIRLVLLVVAGICFAWVALLVQLTIHHKMEWFQAPDWVYGMIVFGPLAIGIGLAMVARRL